jgi:cytochrome P450
MDAGRDRHIVFGAGIHRYLGSNPAQREPRTALRAWHSRIPHYRVKPGIELD